MATLKRQTLDGWIAEAMTDGDKNGLIAQMMLVHVVGSKETEIHAIRFGTGKQWNPKELAELFQAKADAFAQDLPGAQIFSLLACYGDEPRPQARHPFQVIGEPDFHGLTSESPDAKGAVQQTMRHLEARDREVNNMIRSVFENSTQTIDYLSRENRELRDENAKANQALREMVLGRFTEEHKFRMEEEKQKQTAELVNKAIEFAPLLLNTIAGKEVIPQSKVDSVLLTTLARSLPNEVLGEIMSKLPKEVAGAFASRIEESRQADALAEKTAEKALTAGMKPEDDAEGA